MFFPRDALHFTGIGGIGMSGLAEICRALGCPVTGSDLRANAVTARLERLGIRVWQGHEAAHVGPEVRALVATSAVSAANPELAEARRRGLPVVRRGELLAELMRSRRGVAVGGSHGKTTTTAMLARIAIDAGLDPTVVVGTLVDFLGGSNARLGGSDLLVAESDESDGSFLELAPVFSVITNIDREHLDHYGDYAAVLDAFAAFANKAPWYGAVAACADDPGVRSILPRVRRRVVLYGSAPDSRLRIGALEAGGDGSRFRMALDGRDLGEFRLRVAGVHNVLNAAAAAAIAIEIGVPPAAIASSLEAFGGSGRRMEAKGSARGVSVIDDYGHHPAEVRATLEALRLGRPRRLVVLFQPHRYTRTAALLDEFAGAFGAADLVRVTDLYAASEEPIAGVDARALAERIRSAGHSDCRYAGPLDQAVEDLARELTGGDLVVTLGAGSVTEAGPRILDALRRESRHG